MNSRLPLFLFQDPSLNVHSELILRNNRWINQTYGALGLLYIFKKDVVNLKITFQNNTFENVTNSVTDNPAIQMIGESLTIQNLRFRNSHISTGLMIKALSGSI
jgi:hypothetical protein